MAGANASRSIMNPKSLLPSLTGRSCRWLVCVGTALHLWLSLGPLRAEPAVGKRTGANEVKGAQRLVEMAAERRERPKLSSDLDIPQLSRWAREWQSARKRTAWVSTTERGVPARVAVHEVGEGPRVMVCVHGLFGEAANWRYVAAALRGEYELWLIDLPGCGESEAPHPGRLGPGGYGPRALADRVLQAMAARLAARPDVRHLLLAGHSLGGMISLRMLGDEELRERHASTLAAIDGLVLFAPSDVVVTQFTQTQRTMLALNGTKVFLGNLTGILPRAMKQGLRTSFDDPALASRELQTQGIELLSRRANRHATQAMLRDALPWRVVGEEHDWQAIATLERGYEHILKPCLIIWGECDLTLPVSMGYKLKDQLPDARLVVIPRTRHLLPMECPAACAALIRDFREGLDRGRLAAAHTVRRWSGEAMEGSTEWVVGAAKASPGVAGSVEEAR